DRPPDRSLPGSRVAIRVRWSARTNDMILSLDEGTTGGRALLIDRDGRVRGSGYREFGQHFPRPAWVEHDAEEIWTATLEVIRQAAENARIALSDVQGIGITNQRETVVLWDRTTGTPVHRALVWQDRRTTEICERLRAAGHEPEVTRRTGLILDPYFSATKLAWLFENDPSLRERAAAGDLAAGTMDTWLIWKLTG